MKQWYALHTKPHAEQQVRATLYLREIEAYLPEVAVLQPDKSCKDVPFFPCYLFMRVDMAKVSSVRWQWIPGLRTVVSAGSAPQSVPDSVINLIRRNLDEINARGGLAARRFQPGETVRITSGPFSGMLAIFDRPTLAEERVQVLLNFLGQMNRVRLGVHALEKAPADSQSPKPDRRRRTRGRGRRINR